MLFVECMHEHFILQQIAELASKNLSRTGLCETVPKKLDQGKSAAKTLFMASLAKTRCVQFNAVLSDKYRLGF
jgi:hypothetical protein